MLVTGFVMAGQILSGCVTTRRFSDGDASAEEKGQSVIVNGKDVHSIDDIPVVSYSPSGGVRLVIPAGKHTIRVKKSTSYTVSKRATASYTYTSYIPYTLEAYTTFDFEPGKKYALEHVFAHLSYNGRTLETQDADVTVTTSPDGSVHVDNPGMTVVKKGSMLGPSTYIRPEFSGTGFVDWSYKELLASGGGLMSGVTVIHDKLDLKLLGEAGIGILGYSFPDFARYRMGFSAYYGGLANVYFSSIGLEMGGGMHYALTIPTPAEEPSDDSPDFMFSTPYLQAGVLFPTKGGELGIYGRYYLDAEQWYSKFGLGVKALFH
jgi:hypothetical protein